MNPKSRLSRAADIATNKLVEQLENRLMLSVAIKSPKPPEPHAKITPTTQTFKTNINSSPGGAPAPTINVGPVVNISRATGNQTEADIAINPTDTNFIYAVSNVSSGTVLFTSRSSDGGQTWTAATAFSGACCDARTIYDKFGNLYVVYLNSSASSVIIARSINNGASFTNILTRSGSWDNPAIAAGADGQVWIEVRSGSGPAGIGFRATGLGTIDTSLGTGGFTATQQVTGIGTGLNYGDVAVLNDGSIMLTWTGSSGQTTVTNGVARDPDGIFGPTGFGSPIFSYQTRVGGFDFIPAQNGRSVDSEPGFAVAPAGTQFAGRVYMVYAQETVDENNDHDIVIRYTDNNGANWSGEIRVNDDPANPIRSQFLPQITVDPTTGGVICSWHDARNDNGVSPNGTNAVANDDAQFFGALSVDGGLTWTNFTIDPGWSNAVRANNGIDYGDWTGSDYYGGFFFAVWASNAQGVNGLPNNPSPNQFDLATAKVTVSGISATASIGGASFDDVNGNGVRDGGDGGLDSLTVYIDANNNGVPDGGDTTTTTTGGGLYSFNNLNPGTYVIRAVTPAGRRLTVPAAGFYTITLTGTTINGKDFGFVNPRVAGVVFNDTNDNGAFDASESGISGVTAYIDANNNLQFDGGETNVLTDGTGAYSLGSLADGTYIVRVVTPAGRRLTFPAAGSYTRTIGGANLVFASDNFGQTDRARINGIVYSDNNANGSQQAGENGIPNIRVYQDTNNNSIWDTFGSSYPSTDVPKSIIDNGTIQSVLNIGGVGNVTSLTVTMDITHTFDSDLVVTLISPGGTLITLVNRRGGSGDNFTNTTFDDNAATSITAGAPPFTGSFRPEVALSTLAGQNGNGQWKLQIQDAAASNTGTLNSWSITLGSAEPNQLTAADGSYSFTGLTAGSYNIRQVPTPNFVFVAPASGGQIVNPAASQIVAADFYDFPISYTGNQMYLRLDPTSTNVQVWVDQPTNGAPTYTAPTSLVASSTLLFTGTAGNDSLTIDAANGNPLPASGGASFNGLANSGAGDTLVVLGTGAAQTVIYNNGSVLIDGRTVAQSNVENEQFDGKHGNDVLTINGGPSVQIIAPQHLASLTMAAGASASVTAGGLNLIVTNALSMNPAATLDMNDNDMLVFYSGSSPLGTITSLIKNARNSGAWNGTGMTSTSARNRPAHDTSLGAISSDDYKSVYGANASFDGESLAGLDAVLIKYTYYGDTDFNGVVDGADYARVDSTFNQEVTTQTDIGGWFNGDFDYNDKVDGADYALIDAAFNSQLGVL